MLLSGPKNPSPAPFIALHNFVWSPGELSFFHICYSYLSGIKLQLPGTFVGLVLRQIRQEAMQSFLIFHFLFM